MKESVRKFKDILICPSCRSNLEFSPEGGAECEQCGDRYEKAENGQLDMRLKSQKTVSLEYDVGDYPRPSDDDVFDSLNEDPQAQEILNSDDVNASHLNPRLVSYFPDVTTNSTVLDLGCGSGHHRSVCEKMGFEWVGIGIDSEAAPFLGDVHALPFEDDSFEFVLTVAVLEHVDNPFLMIEEINRVLKPGGMLVGTVAFLEDFHGDSMFHHTHYGLYNLLTHAGLDIEVISPYDIRDDLPFVGWDGPIPQTRRLFPLPILSLKMKLLLMAPTYLIDKIMYKIGHLIKYRGWGPEYKRKLGKAGQYAFVATNGVN